MSRFTRIARLVSGLVVAVTLIMAATAFVTSVAANAAACLTTHTYTHTTTSRGSTTQRWTTRTACGRAYQKWEHITERSYTGSRYTENVYRDERGYPHYRQVTDKYSWSKKGTETHTYTIKTG